MARDNGMPYFAGIAHLCFVVAINLRRVMEPANALFKVGRVQSPLQSNAEAVGGARATKCAGCGVRPALAELTMRRLKLGREVRAAALPSW